MTSTSSTYTSKSEVWQKRLEEHCKVYRHSRPVFQIFSDRRGGRTAWSSRVIIDGTTLPARYWYDGNNVNNAKEDAAECAIMWLNKSNNFQPAQHYQAQQQHSQVW